jgi:fumarate hydratase, class I
MITKEQVVELYRKCATELPDDVVDAIKVAANNATSDTQQTVFGTLLETLNISKSESIPICQDTGTPVFHVQLDKIHSGREVRKIIEAATVEATESVPLRPNAVDSITGETIGNMPIIHFEDAEKFRIDLMLKGGGSENVTQVYTLPDERLKAHRDLEGVRSCILDAVVKAQGKGCPPYIIGVAIGGIIDDVVKLSKKQLLRKLGDTNRNSELANLERNVLKDINLLGIGAAGFGGKTTALAVKAAATCRTPASFFVAVTFSCWALRRQSYV